MKIQNFFLTFLLSPIIFCLDSEDDNSYTNYIIFSNEKIRASNKIKISGTTVKIDKPGNYYITGESDEGNIVVQSSKVELYLKNLKLSSEETAPITISKDLKDVKIINVGNTILEDLEDPSTTDGECAVIKIKKNSIVHFKNYDIFRLSGNCKNIIRGVEKTSIIFDKCNGEYIINSNNTAINSDNLLVFNGGIFKIESENGNGIKSKPDDDDDDNIGKILINNGVFNIKSYKDAFVAKKNITILDGKFDIITQYGYDYEIYNVNVSSKGFKVTSDTEGSEIRIYSGNFVLNTADDAFRSNRDMTILKGNIKISSRDDAICAKYNLTLGVKDGPLDDLQIQIIYSYEALEGMTIKIYSGRIRAKAGNDGINASGPIRRIEPDFNFSNRNYTRRNRTNRNNTDNFTNWWDNPDIWNNPDMWNNPNWWNNSIFGNNSNRSNWGNWGNWGDFGNNNRNSSRNDTQRRRYYFFGNDSYYISIFGGEIYVDSDTDGMDSNGNIYIHGGNLNIFSSDKGTDNPIDRDGNLTVFNADVLAVGVRGAGYVHRWIDKGNQFYCFYAGNINANRLLEIRNEKDEIVKAEMISKNISYIFYTSSKLNKNYRFYIYENYVNKIKLNVECDFLEQGEDDEDVFFNNEKKNEKIKNKENNKEEEKKDEETDKKTEENKNENISQYLGLYIIYILILLL